LKFFVNIFTDKNFFSVKSVIEEANWLSLYDDIKGQVRDGFDAVICLGNSFAHMNDNFGDQREQKQAIMNFKKCLKPGGILFIDHRNYDSMMTGASAPSKSIYYNVSFRISLPHLNFNDFLTLNLKRSLIHFVTP
jgi:SAM-dependent methyltransferase